jgi:hypothetical protein
VIIIFDWLGDLIGSIWDHTGGAVIEFATSKLWEDTLDWMYGQVIGFLSDFFTQMNQMGAELFSLAWVKGIVLLFSYFGWALFVAGLAVAVFDTAIEYQSGRANMKDTALNFIKGFMAVSLFTVVPVELYKFCVTLQNTFAHDLIRLFVNAEVGSIRTLANLAIKGDWLKSASFMNLFCLIAMGYCVIKLFFQNIKRGGILLVQIAVGSLYMFSVPRGYLDGFTGWCKQIFGICLTAFLQTTLLTAGLITWNTNWLLGLGVMLAANEVPRIAQQFGLDTSVKANMMSAVYAAQSAVSITRSVSRAGGK